jgi:hypothetical protein
LHGKVRTDAMWVEGTGEDRAVRVDICKLLPGLVVSLRHRRTGIIGAIHYRGRIRGLSQNHVRSVRFDSCDGRRGATGASKSPLGSLRLSGQEIADGADNTGGERQTSIRVGGDVGTSII